MIKFWAPTPVERGIHKNTNFQLMIHQWVILHCSRANKLSTITRQAYEKVLRGQLSNPPQYHNGVGSPAQQSCNLYAPAVVAKASEFGTRPTMTRQIVLLLTRLGYPATPPKGVEHPKILKYVPFLCKYQGTQSC